MELSYFIFDTSVASGKVVFHHCTNALEAILRSHALTTDLDQLDNIISQVIGPFLLSNTVSRMSFGQEVRAVGGDPNWSLHVVKYYTHYSIVYVSQASISQQDINCLHQAISQYLKALFGTCMTLLEESQEKKATLNVAIATAIEVYGSSPQEIIGPSTSRLTLSSGNLEEISQACKRGTTAKNMSLYLFKDGEVMMGRTPAGDPRLAVYSRGMRLATDPRVLQQLLVPQKGGSGSSQLLLLSSEQSSLEPWLSHGFVLRDNISLVIAVRADRFADTSFFANVALKCLDEIAASAATGKGYENQLFVSTVLPYFQRAASELLSRQTVSVSKREDMRRATLEFLKRMSHDKIFSYGHKMESLMSVKEIISQLLTELLNSKNLLNQHFTQLTWIAKAIESKLKPLLAINSRPSLEVLDALAIAGRLEEKHSATAVASVMWMSVDGITSPLFFRQTQSISKSALRTVLALSQGRTIHEVPRFWNYEKFHVFHYGWLGRTSSSNEISNRNSRPLERNKLRARQNQSTNFNWFQQVIVSSENIDTIE